MQASFFMAMSALNESNILPLRFTFRPGARSPWPGLRQRDERRRRMAPAAGDGSAAHRAACRREESVQGESGAWSEGESQSKMLLSLSALIAMKNDGLHARVTPMAASI